MAERTFAVPSWRRHSRWVGRGGPLIAVAASILFMPENTGGGEVAFALAAVALGVAVIVCEVRYRPARVRLTESAVFFEAGARNIFIPWDELTLVHRRISRWGEFLVWRHRNGSRVSMLYGIADRDELRAIVEHCAPDATLRGW